VANGAATSLHYNKGLRCPGAQFIIAITIHYPSHFYLIISQFFALMKMYFLLSWLTE